MRRGVDGGLTASRSRLLLAAGALLLIPAILAAQTVRGRVVDAAGHRPIVGALVELRDAAGKPIRIVLTTGAGNFQMTAPGPARYFYRVAAIGFTPRAPTAITVPAEGVVIGDVVLTATAMQLPDLLAIGRRQFCGKGGVPDETFNRLLESAHTALQIIETTIETHRVKFDVEQVVTKTTYGDMGGIRVADTSRLSLSRWPVESIDPDSLRRFGFGLETRPGDVASREYYGPDERVLFADWFLDSHCFALDKIKKGDDTLHIRFTPAGKSKLIDVGGVLSLNADNLALLQFSFTHRNLPGWMPDESSGGDMEFQQLASGLWIVRSWAIWAPLVALPSPSNRPAVAGVVDMRGHVVKVYEEAVADSAGAEVRGVSQSH